MYFIITLKILNYINTRKQFFEFEDDWPVIGETWRIDKICKYPHVNHGEPVIEGSNGKIRKHNHERDVKDNYRWMRIPADLVFDKDYLEEISDIG